jgi:hypothetical protein
MEAKARGYADDAGSMIEGMLLMHSGLLVLAIGAARMVERAISTGISTALLATAISYGIIGGAFTVIGRWQARRRRKRLTDRTLVPHQTKESIQENMKWLTNRTR